MGQIHGKKIIQNSNGTITVTKWKGTEKTDLFGRKTVVITHRETETKEKRPSLFATLAVSLIGGKSQSLVDYAARARERGNLIEVAQEGKFARSQHKFNSI